ncbi:MAG TPA: amidohydrolase family protein [Acidimicrobiales bacterium]|nr:amidohydrolase family protein [Acidimicrobiales bacterium]
MTYAGERVVHDADSHVMEQPDWLLRHAEPAVAERLGPLWMRGLGQFAEDVVAGVAAARRDPAAGAALEQELLQRKNWWALGASDPDGRSRALDLLGFRSQLVFSTHSSRSLLAPLGPSVGSDRAPPSALRDPALLYEAAAAHNRAMAEFCAGDPRLLAVAWVPLDDPARALAVAREAVALGCAAVEVPSEARGERSIAHVDHDPLWQLLEQHGRPLVLHLGSGGEVPNPVFASTGLPVPDDPMGNAEPLRRLRVVGLAAPVEMAVAALVLDGVLERHPRLRVGVIEQGATWVPGFVRRLDLAVELDRTMRHADWAPGDLADAPSSYVARQVRFTPFPGEPLGWIVEQTDPALYMFSTDFPHAEGGEDPLGQFLAALDGQPPAVVDAFLSANFEALMGPALYERTGS